MSHSSPPLYTPQTPQAEVETTPAVSAPVIAPAPQWARPNTAPTLWAKTLTQAPMAIARRLGSRLLQLQRQYGNHYVQRVMRAAKDEATLQEGNLFEGGTLSSAMQAKIQRAQSGGQSLDNGVAAQMSSAFGTDLSGVRVHTDSTASQLNHDLGAEAFTLGRHIFFDQGQYQPGTPEGQQLLAHELTHVLQQDGLNQTQFSGPLTLGAAHDAYEHEADAMARQVL